MEERIETERDGRPADEIQKLNLDNCQSTEIKGLTDEYKNLTSLSLVNVGLTSLAGLPCLPKLAMLNLSDNRLSGDLELLHNCPNLVYLNLSGNLIKEVNTLEPLKTLTSLQNLELFSCEVTSTEGYREKTFEMLNGLLYLDGIDKNGDEADPDDDDDDDDESDEGLNGGHGKFDDEEDDEEDEVGLEYLQKPDLENESEGEEFNPGEGDHEADDIDDDSEEEPARGGVKRKHEDDEDENGGEGKEAD